jgi:predicted permease
VRWLAQIRFLFGSLFRKRKLDEQLSEEVRTHVEMATEENVAKGMTPDEARYAALREFGNVAGVQERAREERGWVWLEQLNQDLAHAWSGLVRTPGFSISVVLILALGIGAAAAIFGATEWALLRQSNFPGDVHLVCVRDKARGLNPLLNDYMTRGFESSAVIRESAKVSNRAGNVAIDGQPVAGGWVGISPEVLSMLDVTPALGRRFLPGEDTEGSDRVVIISDAFWRRHFQADENIVGREISLGPDVCTVVGVLKKDQLAPIGMAGDIYRPLAYRVNPRQPWEPALFLMVRLSDGVLPELAGATLSGIELDVPPNGQVQTERTLPVVLLSLPDFNRQFGKLGVSWALLAAVGFLYGIACLNTSNLMLVRMLGRRRELSIRLALGAGRWRIVRLLLAESLILSTAGAAAGIVMANWMFPLLLRFLSDGLFWPATAWRTFNGTELLLLAFLTVATSVAVVAVPAVRVLRAQISGSLKDGGPALGESRGLGRLRSGLVILQTAFAVVLLVGATLMTRTFANLTNIDLGYDGTNRVKVQLGYPPTYPSDWEPRLAKLHEIRAALERLPGVEAAGFCNDLFLQHYFAETHTVEGAGGVPLKVMVRCFSRGFEEVSGLRLTRGRPLAQIRSNEVLVSESLARACWPGQDAVGQLMRPVGRAGGFGEDWPGWQIVGVVADTRASIRQSPGLVFYSDEAWNPINYNTYVVKLKAPYQREMDAMIRRALYAFDPQVAVGMVAPLDRLWEHQAGAERLMDAVLKILAGSAAALTVIGLFSVLAYAVDRRMHEFGVRLALGATRANLVQLVVWRGLVLTTMGLVLGLAGATQLTRFIQALLYGTSSRDPVALATVSGILFGAAALACVLPAYRATKVDVTRLLRAE